jgi:predicted RNA-binding Zn-ribbon protein involved in translation (DUF1610 family)
MARLVRGYGLTKLDSFVFQGILPSPGSTTIQCPSCGELIEIKCEDVAREISRAIRKEH